MGSSPGPPTPGTGRSAGVWSCSSQRTSRLLERILTWFCRILSFDPLLDGFDSPFFPRFDLGLYPWGTCGGWGDLQDNLTDHRSMSKNVLNILILLYNNNKN